MPLCCPSTHGVRELRLKGFTCGEASLSLTPSKKWSRARNCAFNNIGKKGVRELGGPTLPLPPPPSLHPRPTIAFFYSTDNDTPTTQLVTSHPSGQPFSQSDWWMGIRSTVQRTKAHTFLRTSSFILICSFKSPRALWSPALFTLLSRASGLYILSPVWACNLQRNVLHKF